MPKKKTKPKKGKIWVPEHVRTMNETNPTGPSRAVGSLLPWLCTCTKINGHAASCETGDGGEADDGTSRGLL